MLQNPKYITQKHLSLSVAVCGTTRPLLDHYWITTRSLPDHYWTTTTSVAVCDIHSATWISDAFIHSWGPLDIRYDGKIGEMGCLGLKMVQNCKFRCFFGPPNQALRLSHDFTPKKFFILPALAEKGGVEQIEGWTRVGVRPKFSETGRVSGDEWVSPNPDDTGKDKHFSDKTRKFVPGQQHIHQILRLLQTLMFMELVFTSKLVCPCLSSSSARFVQTLQFFTAFSLQTTLQCSQDVEREGTQKPMLCRKSPALFLRILLCRAGSMQYAYPGSSETTGSGRRLPLNRLVRCVLPSSPVRARKTAWPDSFGSRYRFGLLASSYWMGRQPRLKAWERGV